MTKTKTSAEPATPVLIVFGYDEQQKPCGAQFVGENPELVAKAAELMDLKVYKATTPDLAAVAKKLPVGRLYAQWPRVRAERAASPLHGPRRRIGGRTAGRPQHERRQRQHTCRPRPASNLG